MPNITEYQPGNLALRPSETGVEAEAQAGRRIGAFYNQAAEGLTAAGARIGRGIAEAGATVVDYMDHQQINAGADHGTNLRQTLTDSWNQTAAKADPHDPTVAAKWQEEVLKPALDQFGQGFSTEKSKDWANRFINQTRQEFFTKTAADMSSLAKDAVTQTVTNMSSRMSNMAINDPQSVDASLSMIDHSIDGVLSANPNIKGPDAARLKLEVGDTVKRAVINAGAYGAISKAANPEAVAQQWAAKYPTYINGVEAERLAREAKTQARTNTLLSKQIEQTGRQEAQHAVEASRNKIWADNVTVGDDGKVAINPAFYKQAAQLPVRYPNAPNATETAKTLLDWGEAQQNKERKVVSDPIAVADLSSRLFSADNPTTQTQLMKANTDGKIGDADFHRLNGMLKELGETPIKDPVFKDTLQAVKDTFTFGGTDSDPMGSAGFARFVQSFLPEYLKQSRTGTLQPNALDMRDPKSLISQYLASSKQSLQQSVSAAVASKASASTNVIPTTVRQGGHTYQRQADGSYKAID